jgi:hypothetical protein
MFKILIMLVALSLFGCGKLNPTADQSVNKQQELLSQQSVNEVGMPALTKFAEKRMMKTILEQRDQEIPTYTYIVGMNNQLTLICNSIGYGLPYSTQYTNPQRVAKFSELPEHGNLALPQADPNGLYSPASADGTWVLCLSPKTKQITPMYIEPRIIVSTFPLQ